jgi:hypothetical protein
MRRHHLTAHLPARLWRAVAVFAVGLVLLLTTSSVSPELHAWLHDKTQPQDAGHACAHHHHHSHAHGGETHDSDARDFPAAPADDDHGCAVTVFAHGIVAQATACFAQPCEGILRAVNHRAFERLALAQPRFLHLPPQAPPAV